MAGIDSTIGMGLGHQGIAQDFSGYDTALRGQTQNKIRGIDADIAREDAAEQKELNDVVVDTSKWDRMYVPLVKRRSDKFFQDYNQLRQQNPRMAKAMLGQMKAEYYNDLAALKTGSETTTGIRSALIEKRKSGQSLSPQEIEMEQIVNSKTWDDIAAPIADDAGVYSFDPVSKMPSYYSFGNRKAIDELSKEVKDRNLWGVLKTTQTKGGDWENEIGLTDEEFKKLYKERINSNPDLFRDEVIRRVDVARELFPDIKGDNYYSYLQRPENRDKRDLFINRIMNEDSTFAPKKREKASDPWTYITERAGKVAKNRTKIAAGDKTTLDEGVPESEIEGELKSLRNTPQWKIMKEKKIEELGVDGKTADKELEGDFRRLFGRTHEVILDEEPFSLRGGQGAKNNYTFTLGDVESTRNIRGENTGQTQIATTTVPAIRIGNTKTENENKVAHIDASMVYNEQTGKLERNVGKVEMVISTIEYKDRNVDGKKNPEWFAVGKRIKEVDEETEGSNGLKFKTGKKIKVAEDVSVPLDDNAELTIRNAYGNLSKEEFEKLKEQALMQSSSPLVKSKGSNTQQSQPSGKIRVRRKSDGKTGTIDEKDFNPNKYDRL